jgi:hypothetical protein
MRRIGLVRTPKATYTLHADGSWRVEPDGPLATVMAQSLRAQFPEPFGGPDEGAPGAATLHQLAAILGGTVELDPRPEPVPGTVY